MEQKNINQNQDYEEIDLRDVINVLIKQKKIIILSVIAAIAVAVAASMATPKSYRAQMLLEVGTIERFGGRVMPVIDVAQVKDKIDKGVYSEIVKKEGIATYAVKTANVTNSDVISLTADGSDPRAVETFLGKLGETVIVDHNKIITIRRAKIENQIVTLKENAEELETDPRYTLVSDCSSERYLAVNSIENKIIELELSLTQFSDTAIVKSPAAGDKPIKPNLVTNTVLGAVLGLFFGLFAALIVNWWKTGPKNN